MKAQQKGMKTVHKSKVNSIMSMKVVQSYESKMWLQSERKIRVGHHWKREGGTGVIRGGSWCRQAADAGAVAW